MKHVLTYLTLVGFVFFVACTQPMQDIQSQQVLGLMRIEFKLNPTGTLLSRMVSSQAGTLQPQSLNDSLSGGIQMQLFQSSTFTNGTRGSGGERFVSATYRIRNAAANGTPYNAPNSNITFLAVSTNTSVAETAVADLRTYTGIPIINSALAQAFKPIHAMRFNFTNNSLETSPGAEDFQVFAEDEISSLSSAGVVPLNYGFVVRNILNTTNRTLSSSPPVSVFEGRVTFAMRFPLQASASDDPFAFSMDFLVLTDTNTRVTQSLEQQQSNSVPAEAQTLTNASVNTLPGSRYFVGSTRFIPSVRLARAENNNPVYLVRSQNTIVVSSNADSGAGTLRQAVLDIGDGGMIDLSGINNQDITLLSPIILGRDNLTITNTANTPNVRVLGGATPFVNSNVRIFETQAGNNITLARFSIENGFAMGRPARGGAILNRGRLTLSAMTIKNNLVQGTAGANGINAVGGNGIAGTVGEIGGDAQGGAIFTQDGLLNVNTNSVFSGNKAIGGSGGAGGNGVSGTPPSGAAQGAGGRGGDANGGAIYVDTGSLALNAVTFSGNNATGGNGGNAGSGNQIFPRTPGVGGNANGGANFTAGLAPSVTSITYSSNTVNFGTGGLGGPGMPPNGTATNPNANF